MMESSGLIIELTVGELVAIVAGVMGLIIAIGAAVASWARTPAPGRSWSGLDHSISEELTRQRHNTEFMQALEKMVDGMNRQHRESLKDMASVILDAAKWIPGDADDAAAALVYEAVDGVPVADKLAELERRAAAMEAQVKRTLDTTTGGI